MRQDDFSETPFINSMVLNGPKIKAIYTLSMIDK